MAPQSMRNNGIYADYEKMAAEGGHRSQGAMYCTNLFLTMRIEPSVRIGKLISYNWLGDVVEICAKAKSPLINALLRAHVYLEGTMDDCR